MSAPIKYVADFVTDRSRNFVHNLVHSLDGMELINYIRLVAVVGAYLLLRPYLMKFGEKLQAKQHEKEIDTAEVEGPKAKISPNALRGYGGKEVQIEDSESEEEGGEATGSNWGKKARKRQRQQDKKLLAMVEERRRELQEDDEDKDIMEYLVDYEEGKDGW